MFEDKEFKISDAKVAQFQESAETEGQVFSESLNKDQLMKLMGWDKTGIPRLAKKSYTYDMRKILGQLTPAELQNSEKREAKELKVKRGKAKIRKLMDRIK